MNVYLILLTYAESDKSARAGYAYTTLAKALDNLRTSHVLKVHIADDGSDPNHVAKLHKIAESHGIEASFTNAERQGYGHSYNLATQHCHWDGDYFLMLEDDWELSREFNLDPLIESLESSKQELGCIRLGYLGWTQTLLGEVAKFGNMSYLLFEPDSTEPHVWSGHPRLESREFQRKMGPWPVGLDPGSTEFVMSQKKESRSGVAWPLDAGVNASQDYCSLFAHIGSVQARSDQMEVKNA